MTSNEALKPRVVDFLNAFKADPFSTGADKADRLLEIVEATRSTDTPVCASTEDAERLRGVASQLRKYGDMRGADAVERITDKIALIQRLREALTKIAAPMPGCAWAATERQEIARAALSSIPEPQGGAKA